MRLKSLALGIGVLSAAGACSITDDSSVGPIPSPPPGPTVRVFSSGPEAGLLVGRSAKLVAQTYDAQTRATHQPIEWSSANPNIATVGKTDGLVTGISQGWTIVTARFDSLKADVVVTVIAMTGTLSFTRTSYLAGHYALDVLSFAASGGATDPIAREPQFSDLAWPAWSPDGTRLAIEGIKSDIGWDDHDAALYKSDIYIVDTSVPGSRWRALTTNDSSRSPTWSPDGARIAYIKGLPQRASHVYIMPAAGGEPVRLTREEGAYQSLRWSPDGTRLAFADRGDVFIMNAESGVASKITSGTGWSATPSWSPDGTRLAYTSYPHNNASRSELLLVSLDDVSHATSIISQNGTYAQAPVWSPDGALFAVALNDAIHVVSADGALRVRITTPPHGSYDQPSTWKR